MFRKIAVEFPHSLCYIRHRKSTHSKVDAPEKVECPYRHRLSVVQTERHFLFLLVVLISCEKGKKRNNQAAKGC